VQTAGYQGKLIACIKPKWVEGGGGGQMRLRAEQNVEIDNEKLRCVKDSN